MILTNQILQQNLFLLSWCKDIVAELVEKIPVGNLTIFGISTDNEKSDCTVLVDWNNQKPFQKAKAAGPYGEDDYSSWTFTYSRFIPHN